MGNKSRSGYKRSKAQKARNMVKRRCLKRANLQTGDNHSLIRRDDSMASDHLFDSSGDEEAEIVRSHASLSVMGITTSSAPLSAPLEVTMTPPPPHSLANAELERVKKVMYEMQERRKNENTGKAGLIDVSARGEATEKKLGAFEMNLRKFWSYLRSEQRPRPEPSSDPSLLSVIRLPDDIQWPIGVAIGSTLFVRPSQELIHNEIFLGYLNRLICPRHVSTGSTEGYIILGNPGIGKSASLNYQLYMASEFDVNVVVQHGEDCTYMFHKDGTVDLWSGTATKMCRELVDSPETLFLFYPDRTNAQAGLTAAYTVVASSPDDRHYSQIADSPHMKTRWMFGWTLEELKLAHESLQPNRLLTDDQVADIEERYRELGGSLQWSMRPAAHFHDILARRRANLFNITLNDIRQYLGAILEQRGLTKREEPSSRYDPFMIFHCFPPRKNSYLPYSLGYASEKTQKMVEAYLDLKTDDAWREYLRILNAFTGGLHS